MLPHPLRTRGAILALFSVGVALWLAACGSDQPAPNGGLGPLPIAFGGAGGAIAATPSGGAATAIGGRFGQAGEMTTLPDVCLHVARGNVASIDDFEDGDSLAVPETGREGYWFTVHDDTTGSVVPDNEFVPVPGGANGTEHAAHVRASGYSQWGALFEVSLTSLSEGVHCPYNAVGFAGVRFYLRGSGAIRVALVTPLTQDKQYGGACDPDAGMVCYDTHTTAVTLEDEWTLYELPWSAFHQRGFGTPAALHEDAVMAVQFAFDAPDLPIDFWLDEVSFWDGKITPTPVSNEDGGTGGAGGTVSIAGAAGDRAVQPGQAGEGGEGGTAGHWDR